MSANSLTFIPSTRRMYFHSLLWRRCSDSLLISVYGRCECFFSLVLSVCLCLCLFLSLFSSLTLGEASGHIWGYSSSSVKRPISRGTEVFCQQPEPAFHPCEYNLASVTSSPSQAFRWLQPWWTLTATL